MILLVVGILKEMTAAAVVITDLKPLLLSPTSTFSALSSIA